MAKANAAKAKASADGKQRHIKARLLYLHKAAKFLAERHDLNVLADPKACTDDTSASEAHLAERNSNQSPMLHLPSPSSSRLLFESRSISLKSQVRLSSLSSEDNVKHQVCRRCSTPLIAGHTLETFVENKSRKGSKNWADVKVVKCNGCGCEKRFPIGAERQRKGKLRAKDQVGHMSQQASIAPDGGRGQLAESGAA